MMGRTGASLPPAREGAVPLAVTMGDPAGIGLDITLEAWRDRAVKDLPPFVVYGDAGALAERARLLGIPLSLETSPAPPPVAALPTDRLVVVPVDATVPPVPGTADPRNAPAIVGAIEQAVAATIGGTCAAVVTNPISKATLYAAGFAHPGHTEFLAELAERHRPGRRWTPVMMLAADMLRVVPLTVHIPLAAVPAAISPDLITETVRITARDLTARFGIARPRLAVAGLNPHAGEAGSLGREEIDVIAPALEALRAEGYAIAGPLSADTLFHAEARRGYDAAICMYHDQALIPLKTLAFDDGVNVTLGLPFVRTSPDHGTAFDIAGTGKARPQSLIAALRLAARMAAAPPSAGVPS
jgi:4-hydroxythreonine-4-phosphate dehydrogenase